MSVLIQGMETPQFFDRLFVGRSFDGRIYIRNEREDEKGDSVTWYPVIEIPPHGRLIDADEDPSKYVTIWDCDCSEFGKQTVMAVDDLNYLPTIIPADKEG